MEEFSSSLLNGRLVFGKYPTTEELAIIEGSGYTHIVNLCPDEEITWDPYVSVLPVINYPFYDGVKQYPAFGWETFPEIIDTIVALVKTKGNKVYVHCKGGHGRGALFCAIVYGKIKNIGGDAAIAAVHSAHQKRTVMKERWRKLGAPQRNKQKTIIRTALDST